MLWTHILAVILGGAIASVGAWNVQGWRLGGQIDSLKVAHATDLAQAKAAALTVERINAATYQKALNEARSREAALQRDVGLARAESDGLRDQNADAARRIAAAPAATVAEYANTVTELFSECSRSYQAMAATADGHSADARALREAWPVAPTPQP